MAASRFQTPIKDARLTPSGAERDRDRVVQESAAESSDVNSASSDTAKTKLTISPGWLQRLQHAAVDEPADSQPEFVVPKNPRFYSSGVQFVDNATAATRMLDFVRQRTVSFIGIDSEFRYSRPGVLMKTIKGRDMVWHDPRSVSPLLLSLSVVEFTESNCARVYQFVVDLRTHEVHRPLAEMLRLPVPFLGHYLQVELFCLWKLDLPAPYNIWDTWTAEKVFCLGLYHPRYESEFTGDELEESLAKDAAAEKQLTRLSLVSTCLRRGVDFPFAMNKQRMQQAFLKHSALHPFSQEQLDYAAADATAAASLYLIQLQQAAQTGCLTHLETIEMPWTVTNARMIWDGVRVCKNRVDGLRDACDQHIAPMQRELSAEGLSNVNSPKQVKTFMQKLGLLELFRRGKKYSFDDAHLEATEDHHPAIHRIRTLRKMIRLRSDKLLTGELVGVDGRLHPDHRQLGSESGRNSMRWPNIGGIGRALRPVVIPEEGNVIGEVDLSQIEVGIAAAVYNDQDLIRMFNDQDVYVAMAKQYYADQLPASEQNLSDADFKEQHNPFRDQMKVFTLAIIYGISDHGLAIQLNLSRQQAGRERKLFLGMFPALGKTLHEGAEYGAIRGYACLCSGLRRYRGATGRPTRWEQNWLVNTPVQGSAGIVFKVAGNRLRRRYEHYEAKLILPLHDAFIFECPEQQLQKVSQITSEVMRSTVQEYFPVLEPRAEANIDNPSCWNKDGDHQSLQRWMANPVS